MGWCRHRTACKKQGEHAADLHTATGSSIPDNIRALYGGRVARELLPFKLAPEDKPAHLPPFECEGQVSNANFNLKKGVLILFINNRLVDSSELKKAIDMVYAPYLPKGAYAWVYLRLDIPVRTCAAREPQLDSSALLYPTPVF